MEGTSQEIEQIEQKEKEDKSFFGKINFSVNTKYFMIGLIIVGVVVYILTQNLLNVQGISFEWKTSLEILKLLSGTAISTGILSLILRISSMKSAIADVVLKTYDEFKRDILKGDFVLDGYDDETLDNIHKKIVLHRSKDKVLDIGKLNNSVYALEKNLANLTLGLHWEHHSRTTVITPDKKNNIFKKRVETEYKVINLHELDNKVQFALSLIKGTKINDNFKITVFKINNENLSSQIDEFTEVINTNDGGGYIPYPIEVKFKKDLCKRKEHTVKLVYEYIIPMNDLSQGYKLSKPCQKLNHTIILDGLEASEWELDTSAYTAWYCEDSELLKEFQISQPTSNHVKIDFNYWSLPGAGYMVTLRKKDNI